MSNVNDLQFSVSAATKRTTALVIAVVLLLAAALPLHHAGGHPELERASPPEDGLLAAPPRQVELWMTERVDEGAGSPEIKVLDADGAAMTVTNQRLDADDPHHVIADVDGISGGTYTVLWTARSADDGHTLTGSFAFRVGTGTAPGAATVQGETPRPWAVATRWLTFLGIALATAGMLYRTVLLGGGLGEPARSRRRAVAVAAGAVAAMLATVAEPFLQTRFPPDGAVAPNLDDALAGMPDAWWLRLAAAALTLLISLFNLGRQRSDSRQSIPALEWAGAAAGLATLLGLSLTSHAFARESWRAVAIASDTLHQWAVALWVGGLAQLALSWPPGRAEIAAPDGASDPDQPPVDPIRRFSRYALVLVIVGTATGVLNAGFVFPVLHELWSSSYGRILIAKAVILVPVLLLATFHRVQLHQAAIRLGTTLRTTVRLEAALVLLVVLGGSVLALMVPPADATTGSAEMVDLATPLQGGNPEQSLIVRLQVEPAQAGENDVTVLVTDADGGPISPDQFALIRVDFLSLDHQAEQRGLDASGDGQGGFTIDGFQLSMGGWWRVETLVRQLGMPDGTAAFYVMLPDPNVNGMDAIETAESSPEAEALYERAMANMTAAQQVRYWQHLSGGTGTFAQSDHLVDAGGEGQPVSSKLISNTFEVITIGDRQWLRQGDQPWREREASPPNPPSSWGGEYQGATGFQLGVTEEINGEQAQMISFVVPGTPKLAPAWYGWWVGTTNGLLLRETMVSRIHYMVNTFTAYNVPLGIEPPKMPPSATPET